MTINKDAKRSAARVCAGEGRKGSEMDYSLYQKFLKEMLEKAIAESDGSNRGVAEALSMMHVGGLFTQHKDERRRALDDLRRAFDEHRHWPREIILAHLGVKE
jgi:hypothetical protein